MTGEYIIIAILIIGSIAGMIWIAPDVREAFSEPFGDDDAPSEWEGEATNAKSRAGGRDSGSAGRLGNATRQHDGGGTTP